MDSEEKQHDLSLMFYNKNNLFTKIVSCNPSAMFRFNSCAHFCLFLACLALNVMGKNLF